MKARKTQRIITARRLISACALALAAVFAVVSPAYIARGLERDRYREWLETETEPKVMIINVWHIVGFKPYVGSLGSWLEKRADEYAKGLVGIHFEVKSLSPAEAESLLSRGIKPDIISFMSGTQSSGDLMSLDDFGITGSEAYLSGVIGGELRAVPYCASGNLLVYDPVSAMGLSNDEIAAKADTPERFKSGKAPACICDIRAAGDLYRASLMGSAPYFEAVPYGENEPCGLVQYLGIRRDIDASKLKYAAGFIAHVISEASQSELDSIGLIPIDPNAEADYETEWLKALYQEFDASSIPPCFEG